MALERVRFSGYGHIGYNYSDAKELESSNSFDIRRLIFTADAKLTGKWNLFFLFDFGTNAKMHEFWTEYVFMPELKVRVGQFKVPNTIENVLSPSNLEIISGAQSVNYISGFDSSDDLYGGSGGRDMGLMVSGDIIKFREHKLLTYKVGIFNGQGINVKDKNSYKDLATSLMAHPASWLSLGGSLYIGKGHSVYEGTDFRLPQAGTNYKRNRWGVGTEINTSPLYLRAEYLRGNDGDVRKSEGYYATASIHVHPKFDIIASYDFFNRDKELKHKQTNYILGGQYKFYKRCRIQAQYIFQDRWKGLENVNQVQTQLQIGF